MGKLPGHYRLVKNKFTGETLFENTEDSTLRLEHKALAVEDVPGYFDIERTAVPKNIGFKKLKQYPGFLIDFEKVESLNGYLKSRFGRSSRYKLRREQKKLEHCFDISYRMYHGEMGKDEYDFIFTEFYRLLEIRSREKGIKNNHNLKTKEHYRRLVYPMILDKRASFYVIYNGKTPIDICLNFHLNNVIFQYIRTYDIAYSKFNTGYIDLIKQIEWCIQNQVKIISFSKGDFYWKRRWCNTVYDYDYHIFYKKRSVKANISCLIFYSKRWLRQLLREKKVIEWYHRQRSSYRAKGKLSNNEPEFNAVPVPVREGIFSEAESIDYNDPKYRFLRRLIFRLLYDTDEKETDISLYRVADRSNQYFLQGKKSCFRIEKI